MRYSNEPRERRYVQGYGFLSFPKNMGLHVTEVAKNLNNKYGPKLVDTAQKSATDASKIASKRATGDVVGNKIADKITIYSKKISRSLNRVEFK